MDAKPIVTVPVGTFQHWRVVNDTKEMHPFHIHQVHFLTYAINGRRISHPLWLDTMNTLPKGTIDVVLDATDPVIRGMSVFHCHILNHEDKGMMAKVLFK
jgi:FtsP/CotA-like multicopper oxidase with cupredoxin domain